MDTILRITDLTVCFGRTVALDNFHFALGVGDFVALAGPNGSGKTTVLRAILGRIRTAAGRIAFPGASGAADRNGRGALPRIGYVPQSIRTDPRMPMLVRDVAGIGLLGRPDARHLDARTAAALIDASLAEVGITGLADRPAGQLSGGEAQKVQLARVLCQAPDLLLVDEPTLNLDLAAQRDTLALLGRVHTARRMSVVAVMHDFTHLPNACRRAVLLAHGRKIYDGPLHPEIRAQAHAFLEGRPADFPQPAGAMSANDSAETSDRGD